MPAVVWGFFCCLSRRVRGRLEEDMAKDTAERVRKSQDKERERLDYIPETVPTPDLVEIVGRVGGDVVTSRVYNDGSVYGK